MVKEFRISLSPTLIIDTVADSFYITSLRLKGPKKDKKTAFARQIAMYLIRQETDCSLSKVGQELGGRSPATVSYAYQKIARLNSHSLGVKERIIELQEEISRRSRERINLLIRKRFTPDQLISELEKRSSQRAALVIMPIDDWKAITDAYHSPLVERIVEDLLQIFPERWGGSEKLSFMAFAREFTER